MRKQFSYLSAFLVSILLITSIQEGNAQHVIGVKSMRLDSWVNKESSDPDGDFIQERERHYLTINPYYELYLSEYEYLVLMIEYEQFRDNSTTYYPKSDFGDERWDFRTLKTNYFRIDLGIGRMIEIDQRFTFKANATIFYKREFDNSRLTKVDFIDDLGDYAGSYNRLSSEPLENMIGFSLTPQLNYNIWKGLNVHLDLRFDLYSYFYKGFDSSEFSVTDADGSILIEGENASFLSVHRVQREANFGLGFSYRF